ncbi:unnamed protein product [Adineta steineri]|uniref:Uncharacterized protein n=1 Tax=Adineta steineri TaxID=433720 RepID=A0A815C1I1_9BILA|nr:unnamed protein product [Adineta steineri]CAF1561441.1 unnamed protein product [Adineta steineri]
MCWISPIPEKVDKVMTKKVDFDKCLREIDTIVQNNGFTTFNRFDLWSRRKNLVISSHGNFSLHGIREINDWFARTLASSLGRLIPPAIPMRPAPISGAYEDQTPFTGKWPANDRQRPRSYRRQ